VSWPVGTIVVCIRDDWDDLYLRAANPTRVPTRGEYYTVREDIGDGIRLQECICNANPLVGREFAWDKRCFRLAESDHSEAGTVRAEQPVGA
jgi:hypothetical protein